MKTEEKKEKPFRGNIYVIRNEQIISEGQSFRDGRVLLQKTSGFADWANRIPNTLDTRFGSASAGKVFVAVGILQLIEQGKLRWEDTLGELVDREWNLIDRDVTVRQLLTHTSGVPDYFDESTMEEYEELWVDFPNYRIRHNSDLLPLFIEKPMMYPKGEKFQYNNSGYVLLALILETITGQEFDRYLQENVFDRCHMHSTGYYELDRLPEKCANHYIFCPDTGDFRTHIFTVDAKGTGAGGAYTTVKDIVRFWENLLNGSLLSKEMVAAMLQKQAGDGEEAYGYGVWIWENPEGENCPYFQGCDPGVSFLSEYHPQSGTISVLMSNYGDDAWEEMRRLRPLLYGDRQG